MAVTVDMRPRPLPHVADVLGTWELRELAFDPGAGWWPFNPSVIRCANGQWLCSIRIADYHMPGGRPMADRSIVQSGRIKNRVALAALDRETLEIANIYEVTEHHETPIVSNRVSGVEDLRLFETEADGLCAVATAMQFNRDGKQEIVLCELDARYQIIEATPLRGMWSKTHQKNWTPYDKVPSVRMLYSIERGGIHDGHGMTLPRHGIAIPPMAIDDKAFGVVAYGQKQMQMRSATPDTFRNGSLETRVLRRHPRHNAPDTDRVDTGPFSIRGGTQLCRAGSFPDGADRWIGLGHGVRVYGTFKFYWHVIYAVDYAGRMRERSQPMKLTDGGIEFAAGLALDRERDRAAISFGVDDESAWIGTTTISAITEQLRPIEIAEGAS